MEVEQEALALREMEADAGGEVEVGRADARAEDHALAVRADIARHDTVGGCAARVAREHGVVGAEGCERTECLEVDLARHRRVDAEVAFLTGAEVPVAFDEAEEA